MSANEKMSKEEQQDLLNQLRKGHFAFSVVGTVFMVYQLVLFF